MSPELDTDRELDPADDVAPVDALALRDPGVPITIDQYAALRGHAIEVLDARVLILETARQRAIRMTHPPDWVLNKTPDGVITGYLQDAGCDRVRDVLGIEVFDVSTPEKIMAPDGQSFTYIVTGCGRSRLTLATVDTMEGGRGSDEDFCKGKTGAQLELLVRKAARANLDGGIVRELTGLKALPFDALVAAWAGTSKNPDHCRKGRGFGTQDERHGGTRATAPDVAPPTCPVCKTPDGKAPLPLAYRPAKDNRAAFYGCPHYAKHPQQRVFVDADSWVAKQRAAAPATNGGGGDDADNRALDAEIARREGLAPRDPGAEG